MVPWLHIMLLNIQKEIRNVVNQRHGSPETAK